MLFVLARLDVSPRSHDDPIAKTFCRGVSDCYMALVEATQLLRTFEINNSERNGNLPSTTHVEHAVET